MYSTGGYVKLRFADCRRAGTRVERDEPEPRDVLARFARRFFTKLLLLVAPRRPYQPRSLVSCETSLAPWAPRWQDYIHSLGALPLAPVEIYRRAKLFKLPPRRGVAGALVCVVSARLAVDLSQSQKTEALEKLTDALNRLFGPGVTGCNF
jgi:hypothetical protein